MEADELWRMSPVLVGDRARRMVESNIAHVLREYLAAGYAHVFLSWVLHRQDLIERLMRAVPVSGSSHVYAKVDTSLSSPAQVPQRVCHLVRETTLQGPADG